MRSLGALWLAAGGLEDAFCCAPAAAASCSPKQAEAAEAAAGQLSDWSKVAGYYRSFRACDEGAMAEGSSEAVARLLVDKWPTLPDLAGEIRRQPGLKRFVLSHINWTLDTSELQTVYGLSGGECPGAGAALCKSMRVPLDRHSGDLLVAAPVSGALVNILSGMARMPTVQVKLSSD